MRPPSCAACARVGVLARSRGLAAGTAAARDRGVRPAATGPPARGRLRRADGGLSRGAARPRRGGQKRRRSIDRLSRQCGGSPTRWRGSGRCSPSIRPAAPLQRFLPPLAPDEPDHRLKSRAAVASTFVAGLELARDGTAHLEQEEAFGPINMTAVERQRARVSTLRRPDVVPMWRRATPPQSRCWTAVPSQRHH